MASSGTLATKLGNHENTKAAAGIIAFASPRLPDRVSFGILYLSCFRDLFPCSAADKSTGRKVDGGRVALAVQPSSPSSELDGVVCVFAHGLSRQPSLSSELDGAVSVFAAALAMQPS